MSTDVGIKLVADGEAQFRQALSAVNAQVKNLNSEMELTVQSFAGAEKSTKALAQKNDVMSRSVDALRQKESLLEAEYKKQKATLDNLGRELQAATEKYGVNSKEAQKAEKAYNNQAKTVNNLGTQLNRTKTEITKIGSEMDNTSEKTSSFGDLLKANLSSAAIMGGVKAIIGAVKQIGQAFANIISDYAVYEQLVGGVETLFGDSSKKVQEYASQAYKTAGLDANAYMETVTSFSASLLQSLGGDTDKAVEVANMAITDMSDNANKMGTDMSSIQNAYQGFAKQNYTMLDNLKLGYGGTKSEMERLLADAEKLTGIKYDINNLDDVYEAIHVIQTEMGITGTTAKEASETISGSIGALKSSWSNLITGLASDDADIGQLVSNVVDSALTVADNLIPRIGQLIQGIGVAIVEALPQLKESIASLAAEYLPQLGEWGAKAIIELANGIKNNTGLVLKKGVEVINSFVTGVLNALPGMVAKIPAVILAFTTYIRDNLPQIAQSGVDVIANFVTGLIQNIPSIVKSLPQIIQAIVTGLANLGQGIWEAGKILGENIVKGLWAGISNLAKWIADKIKGFCDNALDVILKFFGINSPSRVMRDEVGVMLDKGIAEGIKKGENDVIKAAQDLNDKLLAKENELAEKLKDNKLDEVTKENLTKKYETIKQFRSEYESALSDLESAQSSMAEKLAGYGDLFTIAQTEVGDMMNLTDLQAQINAINEYGDALEKLKSRGIDDSLMDEIQGLDIDTATEYMDKLLSMTDSEYDEYMRLWAEKQEASQKVASEFYKTKFADLKNGMTMQMNGYYGEFTTVGNNLMAGLAEGIEEGKSEVVNAVVDTLNEAVEEGKGAVGIASPSKVFAQIGRYMAEGVGVGFDKQMVSVSNDIAGRMLSTANRVTNETLQNVAAATVTGMQLNNMPANNQPIIVQLVTDGQTLAQVVFDPLKSVAKQRGVVLG